MCELSNPIYHDKDRAREHLEAIRWPDGPVCAHCGVVDKSYELKGKSHRSGLYKCGEYKCRKQFTVTVGTVFERSRVPLNKWLLAVHLMTSSKNGISAHQIHCSLGVTYKTAWFMCHRIREAMRSDDTSPMGSGGCAAEADETFISHDKIIKPKGEKKGCGYHHKYKILSLVDCTTGKASSFVVDDLKADTIAGIVRSNLDREARLMTD